MMQNQNNSTSVSPIEEYQSLKHQYESLLEMILEGVTYLDNYRYLYANSAYLKLLGYEREAIVGTSILETIAPTDQTLFQEFFNYYLQGQQLSEMQCHCLAADGAPIKVLIKLTPAVYAGKACTRMVVYPETDAVVAEQKLREVSSLDLLTGLYNRIYFMERLQQVILHLEQQNHYQYSVYYINIDSFGRIKSKAGLAGADIVLSDVASLLKQHVQDPNVVARFGEDIFTLLAPIGDPHQAQEFAQEIGKLIANNLSDIGGQVLQVTASIGIVLLKDKSFSPQEILGWAHQASDNVRNIKTGGNGVCLYNQFREKSQNYAESFTNIVAKLQEALGNNYFKLLFQPIISLRGDDAECYEVYLRLLEQKDKEISPKDFLGIAEEINLCEKIDRWVILNAIKALSAHHIRGYVKTRLFINLTSASIQDSTLLPWLNVALKAARLPGDALVFQISEYDAVTYLKSATALTHGLAELRCRVSISQFGCMNNPLNLLKHLSVDFVKIDGNFIRNLQNQNAEQQKLQALLTACHNENKLTVIPLIEKANILSTLWQIGANFVQGFYLAPPTQQMNFDFSS